mmetsp:Transcript_47995/g.109176  ORF Transcript_47995/g.109176 Transcript_47995/m.109176 type:complete len:1407 (+) Transcript_47995:230-4450(+)
MSERHKAKDKRRREGIENEKQSKHKKAKVEISEESSDDSSSSDKRKKEKHVSKDGRQKTKEREKAAEQKHKKSKDQEKKEKAKSAVSAAPAAPAAAPAAVPAKSPPAKAEKKEKSKKEGKEKKEKKEGKEGKEKQKNEEKKDGKEKEISEGKEKEKPKEEAAEAGKKKVPAEQVEKKLKAWQDDELEVESDDEAKASSKMQALSSVAAKSAGQGAEQADIADEVDPLDAFMADLSKTEAEQRAKDAEAEGADQTAAASQGMGEGMGIMDASRVKTITLEEVMGLMGSSKESEAAAASGADATSDSKAAAAAPAPAVAQPADVAALPADEEEDEDKFHAAFIAEMKKRRGAVPEEDFQPSATFDGARAGFVFKKGFAGVGYYRDRVVEAAAAAAKQAEEEAAAGSGGAEGSKGAEAAEQDDDADDEDDDDDEEDEEEGDEGKAVKEEIVEGKAEEAKKPQDKEEKKATDESTEKQPEEEEKKAVGEAAPSGQSAVEPEKKVVLTKKEKRRLRREAKEAASKENAKKKAKKGFGEEDDERMASDPDMSEQSTEEEQESYFDLVKRFTTKKVLPAVDHTTINYKPFRKNLYIQVKEITAMRDHEIDDMRRTNGDINVRGKHCPRPIKSFLQCGLPEKLIKILEKRDYEAPFPIQMQAIPALMCGRDMIGVAQTGSGKTLAYLLPMIRHVMDQPKLQDGDGPIGFVIAPTRELALQIQREANTLGKAVGIVSVCAYGGGPMGEQLSALKKGAEILVGTPGRLIDVLTTSNGKISNLRRVTFMILDEADRMFDMGFEPQIGMFLQSTRPDKQVAMFSATLPTHVEALARTVLKKPVEITVGERNTAATNVTQFVEVMEESQKFYRLLQLLGEWHEHGSIIIFVHQQKDVDEMFTELLKYGYPPLALHGGQDQSDRDFTLQDFKDGVSNILIATSIAARGIDVKSVILVINFKVPDHLEDYIHRIGRTGRAGKPGFAYTLIQPDEADRAQDMVDALRQCSQPVPEKLKKLAEEHQSQVNQGVAVKKRRWGGFGGKGFKFDNTEKSQQMKDRSKAKKDFMIGNDDPESEEEFKDPWNEDKPLSKKAQDENKKKEEKAKAPAPVAAGANPSATAAAAAEVAARLKGQAAPKPAAPLALPAPVVVPPPGQAAAPGEPPPPPPGPPVGKAKAAAPRKSEKEIEEQAAQMAAETLKNLPEEVREKQLPALTLKLMEKLKKAEQALATAPPTAAAPPPPPAPPPEPVSPLLAALPMVPGVLGGGGQPNMVSRTIEALQATAVKPGAGTAHEAEERAALFAGMGPITPLGMASDELDINDYPQIARQKISHRDPLNAIEEMTGAKVQVRGQYFAANAKIPEGARKLYVEIVGPTTISVQKAKHEVRQMMEALAIRTLNIPGVSRAVMGTPGRYDPAVGK